MKPNYKSCQNLKIVESHENFITKAMLLCCNIWQILSLEIFHTVLSSIYVSRFSSFWVRHPMIDCLYVSARYMSVQFLHRSCSCMELVLRLCF